MPHPTWRPHGTRPRASGSACRRAPEVADGPAPYSGLCGAADAPALSIPGQPGGRPRSCGSGGSGSARPRHGQLWRGTAGASLRPPPCPAALAPLGPPHPDFGSPASFPFRSMSSSILPVPTSVGSVLPIRSPNRGPGRSFTLRPWPWPRRLLPFPSLALLVAPSVTRPAP